MVKKKTINVKNNNSKKRKNKYKSLGLISPFYFNNNNSFIYNIKYYANFKKFCHNINEYKPSLNERIFLRANIESIEKSFEIIERKKNNNKLSPYFQKIYPYIRKVEEIYSKEIKTIEVIMKNRKKEGNISLKKIKEILQNEYKINISRSKINKILKNKLKYKYVKISAKNKDLNNIRYKIISFIFIKILIRGMLLNYNFIFIDESHFKTKNNNYKSWIRKNEDAHFGNNKNEKLNIILAVTVQKVFNFSFIKENINHINFYSFLEDTIKKLSEDDIKRTIIIMDNCTVHFSKNVIDLMKKNNLKIMYTVPYESEFNPIELSFRHIKNIIYRKIYSNITDLKNDVLTIIKSKDMNRCIFKNFKETLMKYENFIERNINIDLNE